MTELLILLLILTAAVLLMALGPWLVIWSWNQLFGSLLVIEFTFWTWLAVVLLAAFIRATLTVKRQD